MKRICRSVGYFEGSIGSGRRQHIWLETKCHCALVSGHRIFRDLASAVAISAGKF